MEHVCPGPRAKVRAPNILFLVDSFQFEPSIVDRLLENHGMDRSMFGVAAYLPLKNAPDLLREVQERVGPAKLRQTGRNSNRETMFPPNIDTVEKALLALGWIYSLHHLGDVSRQPSRQLTDGAIEVRCETPYRVRSSTGSSMASPSTRAWRT